MPNNKALLEVDFRNAFNSIRRNKMMETVEAYTPQLLPFVHLAYSAPSILLHQSCYEMMTKFHHQRESNRGTHWALCCFASPSMSLYPVWCWSLSFFPWWRDHGHDLDHLTADLKRINEEGQALGLILSMLKTELISTDQSKIDAMFCIFLDLVFLGPKNATLLGSPLDSNSMVDCFQNQIS